MKICIRLISIILIISVLSLTAATASDGESDFLKAFRKAFDVNIGVKKVIEENRDLVPGEIRGLLEASHSNTLTPEEKTKKQYLADSLARVYRDVTGDVSYLIEVKRDIFKARLHAPVRGEAIKRVNTIDMPHGTATVQNTFNPDNLIIHAGEWVKWVNSAGEAHIFSSMPFIGKGILFSPSIEPGETWTERFVEPGEYYYFCFIHRSMVGRISVLSADKSNVEEKRGSVGAEHEKYEEEQGHHQEGTERHAEGEE